VSREHGFRVGVEDGFWVELRFLVGCDVGLFGFGDEGCCDGSASALEGGAGAHRERGDGAAVRAAALLDEALRAFVFVGFVLFAALALFGPLLEHALPEWLVVVPRLEEAAVAEELVEDFGVAVEVRAAGAEQLLRLLDALLTGGCVGDSQVGLGCGGVQDVGAEDGPAGADLAGGELVADLVDRGGDEFGLFGEDVEDVLLELRAGGFRRRRAGWRVGVGGASGSRSRFERLLDVCGCDPRLVVHPSIGPLGAVEVRLARGVFSSYGWMETRFLFLGTGRDPARARARM
jgi:hypothetical protein